MSGNMSFLGNMSGSRVDAVAEGTQQQATSSSSSRNNGSFGQLSSSRRVRGSFSFTDGSSILSSFTEETEVDLESFHDKDVWGNRILLSALADIAFSEIPHPKLSPDVIQGLQRFLLSVDAATSACNPFVEHEKPSNSMNMSTDTVRDANISCQSESSRKSDIISITPPKLDLPIELVEGITPECRVVLISLIGGYIRKQVGKIREFWCPILEMNGVTVPELPATSSLSIASQRRSVGPAEGGQLKKLFDLILNQAKIYKNKSEDRVLEDLIKKKEEEMGKYEQDMNYFKQLTIQVMEAYNSLENVDVCTRYMEYLDLETKHVNQQIKLEKLKSEEDERGTEEEQKERLELYTLVKAKYDTMLKETEEMEEQLEKYKSLGSKYTSILEEYKAVDEEVKLKEWVAEQLANGPKDESLFNDSFS